MTTPPLPTENSANSDCAASPQRPRDFADLARRISGRTTDLLAIALVVILLLTVGVPLTRWWRAEPPPVTGESVASAPLSLWESPDGIAVAFDTGSWSLERTTAVGTATEISDAVVNGLRQQLAAPANDLPQIDPAESAWLNKLRDWTPTVETGNGGKVYTLGGPWPWVVATLSTSTTTNSHAAGEARLICWTFALPQSKQSWTLYTARRSTQQATITADIDIRLPDDLQPLLTATTSTGGLLAFRSASSIDTARGEWDRQLGAFGWVQQGQWILSDGLVRGRFQKNGLNQATTLDTTLFEADNGESRGIAEWRTDRPDTRPPDTRHQTTSP